MEERSDGIGFGGRDEESSESALGVEKEAQLAGWLDYSNESRKRERRGNKQIKCLTIIQKVMPQIILNMILPCPDIHRPILLLFPGIFPTQYYLEFSSGQVNLPLASTWALQSLLYNYVYINTERRAS